MNRAARKAVLVEAKMTTHEIVERYADQWRSLVAWGAPLPMKIEVVAHKGTVNLGLAWSTLCKAKVRVTGNLARDLATLLHEMAHLAAPNSEHHGIQWKTVFARAAAEALDGDFDDFDLDVTKYDMDQMVMDMVEAWLETR
jgi:hypothetical protein